MQLRFIRSAIFAILSIAPLTLAACSGSTACTEIGCNDQIAIALIDRAGAAVSNVRGTVVANGATIAITCDATTRSGTGFVCPVGGQGLVLPGITAATVHITLTPDGSTTATDADVTVTTATTQPNGPNCPPVCSQGHGTVTLM